MNGPPFETISALLQRAGALPAVDWLAALVGLGGSYLLRAMRLHAEWHDRTGASLRDCLRLFLLHNAAVAWVPMRGGEAGYPLGLQRRWGVPLQASLPSLLWLRLQDAGVLAALSLGTLGGSLAGLAAPSALLLSAALLLTVVGPLERHLTRWSQSAEDRPRWTRWRAALLARRGGRRAWHCCIGNWVVKLTVIAALLGALGLPGTAALRGALAGEWAGVLPVQAPGGFGSYEAAVWAATSVTSGDARLRESAPAVLGAALLVHALTLALAGSAGVAALLLPGTPRSSDPVQTTSGQPGG
jgi:hypothetical protein